MTAIDEVIAANAIYARTHEFGHLAPRPKRKLAVLACMDTRISIRTFGLSEGDAHVIRNAGGIVTDDALRSLIVSHYLLGTEEFMIINHTDCGMMHASEETLRAKIQEQTSASVTTPDDFFFFKDIEENVRLQVRKLQSHPWVPKTIVVRGFVYDVGTGRLREIES